MKRILSALVLCALFATVYAAGGPEDPLASLSYLNGPFTDGLHTAVDARLNAASFSTTSVSASGAWNEVRLKQDDLLLGTAGDGVLFLAGGGQVVYPSGAVVDVTEGSVIPSGGVLQARHRYLVAEETSASFQIIGKTAVLDWQGRCTFSLSGSPNYNAIAAALKTLGLFRGSLTGYGQGFDLEAAPTRLQALIMFVRVLGEESAALSWNGVCPFQDIQPGSQAEKYVGYAYERGYTNGYSTTEFRPSATVSASQYVEFLLRALGYSSAANTQISDALERAESAYVLTPGETAILQSTDFLRADLVYVSYYALDARLADGTQTLGQSLMERNVFDQQARDSAKVSGSRL